MGEPLGGGKIGIPLKGVKVKSWKMKATGEPCKEEPGIMAQAREFLRETSGSLSVVFVVGWRGPSVVVVGGRGCCGNLDAL